MDDIRIDVGVDTILEVDLTDTNFLGIEYIVLTIKNTVSTKEKPIVERKFNEAKIHEIKITAEESIQITPEAQYDFQKVLEDGTRLKITDNGKIKLRRGIGDKLD